MHKRTKPADLINCRCKNDRTGRGPGRMFKANGENCKCTIVEKARVADSSEFKVKRVAVSIG